MPVQEPGAQRGGGDVESQQATHGATPGTHMPPAQLAGASYMEAAWLAT